MLRAAQGFLVGAQETDSILTLGAPFLCFISEDLGPRAGSAGESILCAGLTIWAQALGASMEEKKQFSKVASGYGTCL